MHRWGILHRKLSVRTLDHVVLMLSAMAKLHNKCIERRIPEHKGRVMSDTYGGPLRGGGADQAGVDWAEWRIAPGYLDPATRVAPGQRRRQRFRDVLRDRLARAEVRRPETSTYRGYTDPAP